LVILLQPSVDSSLKIRNRSFWYAAPHLWNKLALSLPQADLELWPFVVWQSLVPGALLSAAD